MVEARTYRFKIDAYTPATMPMGRLAEYMVDLAKLLGERSSVHFVDLEEGSTALAYLVEAEAVPKVEERVARTQRGEGPPDAMDAERALNRKLREDNGTGALIENDSNIILTFPGRDLVAPATVPGFTQGGMLDGIIIRLGGKDEIVPVHLDTGTAIYSKCQAHRGVAKRLAQHLFTTELRVRGEGRWHIDDAGTWVLDRFIIQDFDILDSEPLTSVVSALRAIPGANWDNIPDPWADLNDMRRDPNEPN